MEGAGPCAKRLESETLGSGTSWEEALKVERSTGSHPAPNHPQTPPRGGASMGAQPRDIAGHVLGECLRPLANGLEKFGNTLSLPRVLLGSGCSEENMDPTKLSPKLSSFFPRWVSRARQSQGI